VVAPDHSDHHSRIRFYRQRNIVLVSELGQYGARAKAIDFVSGTGRRLDRYIVL
jgi:hypothetical protein